MARRYLLPCGNCDQKIAIETTQAGQTITCSGCQAAIKIGTLRDIRALSSAEQESAGRTVELKSAKMSATNRAIFVASVLVLAVGVIWGLMSTFEANRLSAIPVEVQLSDEKVKRLESIVEAASPIEMLQRWGEVKEEVVAEWVEDPSLKVKRAAKTSRLYSWIAFGLAGLAGLGITSSLIMPKSNRD